MREKYIWPSGTPVLLTGHQGYRPRFSEELVKDAGRHVFAGRLADTFRPGGGILLEPGPMSINLPARGYRPEIIVADVHQLNRLPDVEYIREVEAAWKGGFALSSATPDTQGLLHYRIFRDVAEVRHRICGVDRGFVDELERGDEKSWSETQRMAHDIARVVSWLHGPDSHRLIEIEEDTGLPKRWCSTHVAMHSINAWCVYHTPAKCGVLPED